MDPQLNLLAPLMAALLLGWSVLRRMRRSFGRQPLHRSRLLLRAVILAVAGTALTAVSATHPTMLASLLGGMLGGVGLSLWSLRRTSIESASGGPYYVPHAGVGIFIAALFAARVAYRLVSTFGHGFPPSAESDMLGRAQGSPLTLGIFGLLVGYYVVYNLGVLRRSRGLSASVAPSTGFGP